MLSRRDMLLAGSAAGASFLVNEALKFLREHPLTRPEEETP